MPNKKAGMDFTIHPQLLELLHGRVQKTTVTPARVHKMFETTDPDELPAKPDKPKRRTSAGNARRCRKYRERKNSQQNVRNNNE